MYVCACCRCSQRSNPPSRRASPLLSGHRSDYGAVPYEPLPPAVLPSASLSLLEAPRPLLGPAARTAATIELAMAPTPALEYGFGAARAPQERSRSLYGSALLEQLRSPDDRATTPAPASSAWPIAPWIHLFTSSDKVLYRPAVLRRGWGRAAPHGRPDRHGVGGAVAAREPALGRAGPDAALAAWPAAGLAGGGRGDHSRNCGHRQCAALAARHLWYAHSCLGTSVCRSAWLMRASVAGPMGVLPVLADFAMARPPVSEFPNTVFVGHKHNDADSICSAIAAAHLFRGLSRPGRPERDRGAR
jgi:hypothetical protein